MWQTGNNSISKHEIHVLLVDHERDYLIDMATQLKSCSFKVTTVEHGRVAMSKLTKGKHEFDLLLADYNLPDMDVIKLLQVAVHLNLPSILMSEEYDDLVAEMAINNGAILFLQKPFTKETSRNFWQYVMKERVQKQNRVVPQDVIDEIIKENGRYIQSNPEMASLEKENQNDNRALNGVIPKRTPRKKYMKRYRESDSRENHSRPNKAKRKTCTEWTDELHSRFVAAVNHLGDGRCYPKEILDLMNVPGLTRMQVASHLQKCRNDDWRAPNIRRPAYPYNMGIAPTLSNRKANIPNPRKFGAMPSEKKQNTEETLGNEMVASGSDTVQSIPNPSNLENQQVTPPLSQSPLPILPPPSENVNLVPSIPTPTPSPTFPQQLENVSPMQFVSTSTPSQTFPKQLENVNPMPFIPTQTPSRNFPQQLENVSPMQFIPTSTPSQTFPQQLENVNPVPFIPTQTPSPNFPQQLENVSPMQFIPTSTPSQTFPQQLENVNPVPFIPTQTPSSNFPQQLENVSPMQFIPTSIPSQTFPQQLENVNPVPFIPTPTPSTTFPQQFQNIHPMQFAPTPTPSTTFPQQLENVNPRQFVPTPTPSSTFSQQLENFNPMQFVPTPTPSPTFPQQLENFNPMQFVPTPTPSPTFPQQLENFNPMQFVPTSTPSPTFPPPTPSLTFPPQLENVNSMRFVPTPNVQMNVIVPFGGYSFLGNNVSIPTMVTPSSNFGVGTNTAPSAQELGASMGTPLFNQGFDFCGFSDINLNGGDFHPGMMENPVNNINELPEPSNTAFPISTYQQIFDDFTKLLTDQNATTTDNDISGLWNMGALNTNDQP